MIPLVDLKKQYASIAEEIGDGLSRVLTSSQYILGEEVIKFEEEFAEYLEVGYVIGVGSGTEALHLSLVEAGIGAGDEVIVPANTYIATALGVSYTGATPVFVDINEDTFNIDSTALKGLVTEKTKAIIPVHLYGQSADMDEVMAIAGECGLTVIEDACQAHGARYKDKRVGGFGRSSSFSFFPGKNLGAYGDGGAIATNDPEVIERLKALRNYGQKEKYHHDVIGFNSRLDSMQAAVLRVKLRRMDGWNKLRREAAKLYTSILGDKVMTPALKGDRDHVFHIYAVRVAERDRVLKELNGAGIGAGIHYPLPLHLQQCYRGLGYRKGDFPVTERIAGEELSLPIFPEIDEASIHTVAETLLKAL